MLALIAALGETSAILVGHDWGATLVYSAAQLEPKRVKKLITLAIPHPTTLKPTLRQLWQARHFLLYELASAPRRFAADDFAQLRAIYVRWNPTWDPSDEELAPVRECFSDPGSLNAAFGYYRALSFRPPEFARRKIGAFGETAYFLRLRLNAPALIDFTPPSRSDHRESLRGREQRRIRSRGGGA